MKTAAERFQEAEWDTPGWGLAKEVVVALNSVANPETLDSHTKIHLIQQAMKAATESPVWLEFLIAVSGELLQGRDGQRPEP